MKKVFLLLVAFLFVVGCKGLAMEYIAQQAIMNISKIESFSGTIREKGLLEKDAAVRTTVAYKKPDKFVATILEPDDFKGDTFLFDGKEMRIYYKSASFGVVFTGLPEVLPDTTEMRHERIRRNLRRGAAENKSVWKGRGKVAGRWAHNFLAIPKEKGKYRFKNYFWSDSEYSMPMKVTLFDAKGAVVYSFKYEDIVFNKEIEDKEFEFEFPYETTVGRWKLDASSFTLAQVKKDMNFEMLLPTKLPKSMKLKRIVKAPGFVPATCLIYSDGLYYLMLTEMRDYEIEAVKPRGIKVPDVADGARLLLFGESSIVSWKEKGVILTLTGNLPYHDVVSIAESIE
ncbi:outer membrane lipoprotein carrier protein LolA [Elusimicrobiota bacterium]